MSEAQVDWQSVVGGLMRAIALSFAISALVTRGTGRAAAHAAWRQAYVVASASLLFAVASFGAWLAMGSTVIPGLRLPRVSGIGPLELDVRLDALSCSVLMLVTFVGWVILRFSRRYLDGDPGFVRFVAWIQATLAAVTFLVTTNHLMLLAAAWIATSLALHQLLTHFDDRPPALIAAHKKFIASRIAEVCVVVAVILIGGRVGSFELDALFAFVASHPEQSGDLTTATVLLAIAALLKCAQMPFHGWLIQVMEAPTPVSALLHAGVVNIGGFLMIRLAPLMAGSEAAQQLLVLWGATNAVVAALVMTTRVSIKVALAWSTCAQMGFMLMECGLGAYGVALLHLIAHSLYKAHAFLSSGTVVEQYRIQALLPAKSAMKLSRWLAAVPFVALAILPAALAFGLDPVHEPALVALGPIFVFALVPFAAASFARGLRTSGLAFATCAGLAGLYAAGHVGFGALLGIPAGGSHDAPETIALALVAFVVLFGVQGWISAWPRGALARWLYPKLFAGLFVDELFTRLTFRLWPARLPLPDERESTRASATH